MCCPGDPESVGVLVSNGSRHEVLQHVMCMCFSFGLHCLYLPGVVCTGCILTHSQHVKNTEKHADLNEWSVEQPCALWQVCDEKQAEEIFKMLLVTPLCNALQSFATLCCDVLTCFDLRRFMCCLLLSIVVYCCLVCLICFTGAMSC